MMDGEELSDVQLIQEWARYRENEIQRVNVPITRARFAAVMHAATGQLQTHAENIATLLNDCAQACALMTVDDAADILGNTVKLGRTSLHSLVLRVQQMHEVHAYHATMAHLDTAEASPIRQRTFSERRGLASPEGARMCANSDDQGRDRVPAERQQDQKDSKPSGDEHETGGETKQGADDGSQGAKDAKSDAKSQSAASQGQPRGSDGRFLPKAKGIPPDNSSGQQRDEQSHAQHQQKDLSDSWSTRWPGRHTMLVGV